MTGFHDLENAYRKGLLDLLDHGQRVPSVLDPTSPASSFGTADRPAIELLGYSFMVSDPHSCLLDLEARPLRLPYYIGSLIWTLSGSNDVDFLGAYHPQAVMFSDDGISLSGAFGRRLFHQREGFNQIERIVERLKVDRASRRTFAAVCSAEDNFRSTREYPCCIGLQYFIRNEHLHAITYMRAQHALLILPYDVFLFMAMQCLIASRLGVNVGDYRHVSGTFHIYESEVHQARTILDSRVNVHTIDSAGNFLDEIQELVQFEHEIRSAAADGDGMRIEREVMSVPCESSFSQQVKLVFLAHWLFTLSGDVHNSAVRRLPKGLQTMLIRQWQVETKKLAASNSTR